MTTTLEDLMAAASLGDSAAFDELTIRITPEIQRFLYHKQRDYCLAEDLAQDTMLKVLRHRGSYQHGRPVLAWVKKIALRLLFDHGKRPRAVPVSQLGGQDDSRGLFDLIADRLIDSAPSVEAALVQRETLAETRRCLPRLPGRQAESLLRYCNGDSFRDIAADAGVCVNTVKSSRDSAVRRLASMVR